jgi:hypothetical protein
MAIVALLLLPAAFGQQVTVRVTPPSPLVADAARLDVEVSAPPGIQVELPDSVRLNCAATTEVSDAAPQPVHGGRILYRRSFVLDLDGPGPCRVPPLAALYGEAQIASPELVFNVRSAIANEGPDPDISDNLAPVPYRKPTTALWPIIGGILLAVAAVACAILLPHRRWRGSPNERPEARARRRLAGLAASPPGEQREFWTELTGILGQYLDGRFGMHTSRRTSEEILQTLRRLGVVTAGCDAALEALLAECDRGRYGGAHASEGDRAHAVELCRGIVDALGAQAASTPRLVRKWERWDHAAV